MNKTDAKSNKMSDMLVNKLMINMGVPMIISMMLQAVYNIVDSAFLANMEENGEQALNALTLAFPVQMLMVAIGIGTGVGVNVLLAKSLGQKDFKKAAQTTGNGVLLMAVIYVFFLLFGFFGVEAYIKTQTQKMLIVEMATKYLKICCIWSFGILYFSLYEKVLQAAGKSLYSTIAQVAGALVNIILDPIMIYGLLGCPKMGVDGAAYATVIGQIVSALLGLLFHLIVNGEIKNGIKYIKPLFPIIKGIYSVGFPAIISQALMSFMTYLLNVIFIQIGENVVTAYGLYYKIQQFVLFAAFGLRDAITPIISFSYGMKNKERIKAGIKYGLIYTVLLMFIGFVGLEILAEPFAGSFGLSGETKGLCVQAMRIISFSYVFAGANVAFQGIFQALDGGFESMVISVLRQFVFVVPTAYGFMKLIVSGYVKTGLIWTSFVMAEILTVLVAVLFMKKTYKKQNLI